MRSSWCGRRSIPAERARILRLLIERIDVAPDGIFVTLHAAGIRSLVAELAGQEASALAASEPLLEDLRLMTECPGPEIETLTILASRFGYSAAVAGRCS